uniref:Uncharacterized protein n=1 Tax=Avena sativa TaxID=4498 RepID=A0ACD5YBS8_AVESA
MFQLDINQNNFLFSEAESCIHDWPTTFKIIKGTCEAIDYLHRGRGENNYIYHLDLKPDNILMDKNMVPKIGDFGLSRLFNDSATHQTTTAKGTIGFMPPEFTSNGIVTPKNDVFSLGVIIFHLMAGEKGYNDYCDLRRRRELLEKCQQFIDGVQEYWKKTMQTSVGYTLTCTDLVGVMACLQMAMRCVDDDRDKRPGTREMISDLAKLSDQIEKMPTIVQRTTRSNMSGPVAAHAAGRGNLDVVIVYAFDCTNSTPAWEKVGVVFSLVEKKLANFVDSRLGYVYVMSTSNTYKSDINFVDPSKKGESSATRAVCTKNMAAGLPEAHKLMRDNGDENGIILLFSDGLINTGDFFDGAEDFMSTVAVHTFTLGGDAFNDGLQAIAANSPGGTFIPFHVPDKPVLSVHFTRQLDSILSGTAKDDQLDSSPNSGRWPLDVVIIYAFDCTTSTPAWHTVNDVYELVQGKLSMFVGSCLGFTYLMSTPNTYTSDMTLVGSNEKSSAWSRDTCTKNMASGLTEAHKLIGYRGHSNSIILLFSDGLINKGDFFEGAEDFISKVPVHTFTLGGDEYNYGLRAIARNSPGGVFFNPLPVPNKPSQSVPFSRMLDNILNNTTNDGRWPLDVVIVYAFDCTESTPDWYKVGGVYSLVEEKLKHLGEICLGFIYVMSTPNTYVSDMNLLDPSKTGYTESSARSRTTCIKNMASGLPEAHRLMSDHGHLNGMILLFSDGQINKGDFFDGAEDFISKVPVHTFTLGGDAYNHGLHTIASNSPGGSFSTIPLTDMPSLSVPFLRQLDSLLDGTTRDDSKHPSAYSGSWPLDVVIVYAFDCTESTPAWYTVGDVYSMVQGKLLTNSESSIGFTYVMLTPKTCTSDMNLVSSIVTGYEKSSARSRTTCVKNMACGLLEAHKLISYRGHWNSLILLFSDGLVNKGDFFDGAEDYISKVPVHTFTLGGDAYNHGLRSMAANSPGGKFHDTQVPDKPILSETFSRLLDSIIVNATKAS